MTRPRISVRMGHLLAAVLVLGVAAAPAAAQRATGKAVTASYLYTLASFTGPIRQDWSRMAVDRERHEVYALFQNRVHVFNDAGMEVFQFGDDLDLGDIIDVQVDERGNVLLLSYRDASSPASRPVIVRCDFRGRPQAQITLKSLPAGFTDLAPNRMAYANGQFAFASTTGLKLVLTDREGTVKMAYDLFQMLDLDEKDRGTVEFAGFTMEGDGTVLLTVPVLFQAFVLSPDGRLTPFGKPGSAPGRFNITGGIARDSRGNFLVVDRLKGSVQVFDQKFDFLSLFSTRGYRADQLVFPDDVAFDGRDRVYVTQMGRRGISVFRLN